MKRLSILFAGLIIGAGITTFFYAENQPCFSATGEQLSCPATVQGTDDNGNSNFIQSNNHDVDYVRTSEGVHLEVDRAATIRGKSMRPTVFGGHTFLMREVNASENPEELREGTIISFETDDGGSVSHRIEGNYIETNDYVTTRGDNNRGSERVRPDQINYIVIGALYTDN